MHRCSNAWMRRRSRRTSSAAPKLCHSWPTVLDLPCKSNFVCVCVSVCLCTYTGPLAPTHLNSFSIRFFIVLLILTSLWSLQHQRWVFGTESHLPPRSLHAACSPRKHGGERGVPASVSPPDHGKIIHKHLFGLICICLEMSFNSLHSWIKFWFCQKRFRFYFHKITAY